MAKAANAAIPNQRPELAQLSDDQLKDAFYRMSLIRRFEEEAEQCYMKGFIHGTMHLSIGQEASAVGTCMALNPSDYITSTHRGHGHCIGKGADPKFMLAEFFGKRTGYCRGRGGSMHIADIEAGNLGANGIVGGGLPIAAGAALSIKMRKADEVVICFFGDGASNEGAFHEALNMASIWKLPVVFVCENNQYGMSMAFSRASGSVNVADRAVAYSMPGIIVDGNDLPAVHATMAQAVARARAGEGPSLVEYKTYRTRGHSRSDRNLYRTKEDIEEWKARCPIERLKAELTSTGRIGADVLDAITARVHDEIAAAVVFAQESEAPDPSQLAEDVYA